MCLKRFIALLIAVHFEVLHLVLNLSSLWGLAPQAEPAGVAGSSLEFLRLSLLLLLGSGAACLALHHVAIVHLRMERLRHTAMVGYSCVLFGWMTNIALRSGRGARFNLLGLTTVPMLLAPFLLLAATQLIIPNASFLGHLSGILAGLALASGLLDWLNLYWTVCLVFWVALGEPPAGICYGLVREGRVGLPYVRILPATDGEDDGQADVERGPPPAAVTSAAATAATDTLSSMLARLIAAPAVPGRPGGPPPSLGAGPTTSAGPALPWGVPSAAVGAAGGLVRGGAQRHTQQQQQ
ncbi:hypothetical protein TSOC_006853 [Tetrabaena socialis]|uniref:Peptidase S54 rhomboid domain-containing protein n=1 Tax=Tetrabaena socialis TaxID=47790 RepID=A0A2J8A2M1_9CHLO|nr:hypothetical protein TSOC_006853 [Tetrabaena socialis]|eukprot:PNH06769.1 hypothetical protein TSOC_006853 [Tetrabaena socialis]